MHVQIRALIEGQFVSMRGHAERFGMPSPPKRIIATGGASANHTILTSIASIFGCNVYTVQRPGKSFEFEKTDIPFGFGLLKLRF